MKKESLLFLLPFIFFLGLLTWFEKSKTDTVFEKPSHEKEKEEENEKRTQIERAAYDFMLLRDPATNTIPKDAIYKASKAAETVTSFALYQPDAGNRNNSANERTLPTGITVDVRGPINYGGRTRGFAFDTRNTNIMVAGGVSGGIFRSTDKGSNWTSVTPAGQFHNATTIVQDQNNKDIWYAGTGESNGNSAGGEGATYFWQWYLEIY